MKLARIAEVSRVLIEEGLGYLTEDGPTPDDPEVGARLSRTLFRLGPTFVKFGQMVSTRVDLFSEPVLAELAKLQASAPPFDHAVALEIIERELGRPPAQVFGSLPDTPVAAASIAQVYKALLVDGTVVAVKVQRPRMEETLLADLEALLVLSKFLDRLVPPYHRSMLHRVAEEYALRARTEIDFTAEARAMDRFGDVLGSVPEFRAPTVYHAYSTPRLLVMEWIEGTRLDTVAGPDDLTKLGFAPDAFCRSLLTLQLSMAYEHGFVHGDTHPGNLLLEEGGRIGLIDFGLHGQVPRAVRDKMFEVVVSQVSGKTDAAVEAFVQVFQPEPGVDLDAFKAELRPVLSEAEGSLTDHRITTQLVHGLKLGAKHRLRAQSDLFMVIRNLTIIEGIVLHYAPAFDTVGEVKTIVQAILRRKVMGRGLQEELADLAPQVALSLAQRPRLTERLLAMERVFTDSKNLGEFLRQQDVIRDVPPRNVVLPWAVAAGAIGVAVGMVIERILAGG